jgi:hypothetical protein
MKRMKRTQSLIATALVGALAFTATIAQAADPSTSFGTGALPAWNDGPAKQAIVEFVQATTTQGSPKFVAPEARIAVFDQDGTTWVEQPMYTQVIYCLERVPAIVKAKPELAKVEPFKTVLSGDREAMAKAEITVSYVNEVSPERITFRTTFRDSLSSRQIALIDLQSEKYARRIFAIVSTISIPTSASQNHGSQCGPTVPGSRLEADHPENGVPIARRNTPGDRQGVVGASPTR